MSVYSNQPVAILETPKTHPFLTFLGVVLLIGVAWWAIASFGVKKGKKAPKGKKGVQAPATPRPILVVPPGTGSVA